MIGWLRFVGVVIVAVVVAAGAVGQSDGDLVIGKLLVATDDMPDPRFAETVIYMVQHGPEGAMGVVLNRPIQSLPMAEILDGFGVDDGEATGDITVFAGGPVFSNRGFVLHSADYVKDRTLVVDGDLAFTAGIEALRDTVDGVGPARMMFFVGVSSWGPGQLESELQRPGWIVVPADPEIVFDDDLETKWKRALAREGIDL